MAEVSPSSDVPAGTEAEQEEEEEPLEEETPQPQSEETEGGWMHHADWMNE